MNLHLMQYNNYYNRRVMTENSLSDYIQYVVYVEPMVNFNPNDGVTTSHIIGGTSSYTGNADYMIVTDEDFNIVSRWFIIENRRTRGGQFEIILKRDSIADHFGAVLNAPCFIEKGWVPSTDSAVFNKEDMTFNQIKKSEALIQDRTRTPWLVGYYTKNQEPLTVTVPEVSIDPDITVAGIENWNYYQYISTPAKRVRKFRADLYFNLSASILTYDNFGKNNVGLENEEYTGRFYGSYYKIPGKEITDWSTGSRYFRLDQDIVNNITEGLKTEHSTIYEYTEGLFTGYSESTFETLYNLYGRTVFDSSTGKLYRVNISLYINKTEEQETFAGLTSNLGLALYDIYKSAGVEGAKPTSNSSGIDFLIYVSKVDTVQITLEPMSYEAVTITIDAPAAAQTKNSPYNIFALPYGAIIAGGGSISDKITIDKDLSFRILSALIEKYSGTNGILHDVQLLPYCPSEAVAQATTGYTSPQINFNIISTDLYGTITIGDTVVGFYLNCPSTSIKTTSTVGVTVDDVKISNETEFCRLVSPNWNGIFEFTPAKNYGVDGFTIDMELKPYNPYIHVAPIWNEGGLYGNRENDAIGLICGGDFGLTMVSDAWATYERQNKNFQAMFDRQIQNLEVQQRYGRLQDIVGAVTGTAQGAATGAAFGTMINPGAGSAIGAGVAGLASAAGGAADLFINEQLRREAIDYSKDQFGYQLGNIRALPDSLTKVNSFNPNNHLFPILEFYGCTEEETQALKDKIKYNGMSIGRIGNILKYMNPSEETYIKGQIILLNIPEDSHLAYDISNEIYKGVRI